MRTIKRLQIPLLIKNFNLLFDLTLTLSTTILIIIKFILVNIPIAINVSSLPQ